MERLMALVTCRAAFHGTSHAIIHFPWRSPMMPPEGVDWNGATSRKTFWCSWCALPWTFLRQVTRPMRNLLWGNSMHPTGGSKKQHPWVINRMGCPMGLFKDASHPGSTWGAVYSHQKSHKPPLRLFPWGVSSPVGNKTRYIWDVSWQVPREAHAIKKPTSTEKNEKCYPGAPSQNLWTYHEYFFITTT